MIFFRFVIFLTALACTSAWADEKTSPITLNVTAKGEFLHMRLTNNSDRRIGVIKGALPWVNGISGARLYGYVGLQPPREMRQLYGVQSNYDVIEIDSRESIDGFVDLSGVFPGFSEYLKKEPIVIFWAYTPLTEELKKIPPLHGLVVLMP